MRSQSVVNLSPIDTNYKTANSNFNRFFKTRHFRGQGIKPMAAFGHYIFCGPQGSGKTLSLLWYYEFLRRKYESKKKMDYKIDTYSNFGVGNPINNLNLYRTIFEFDTNPSHIKFVLIDELSTYYPRDTKDLAIRSEIDYLVGIFSQLRKRKCYVLTSAQVYGRVEKSLREQCLYMVACRKSKITNKIVNDFIKGEDVLCDDLGRWSGIPSRIYVHGLPKISYNTNQIVYREQGIFQLPLKQPIRRTLLNVESEVANVKT